VKPLARRNRSAAKEIPLIAWRTPLFMRKGRLASAWVRRATGGALGAA
jgi:hypothetical protein